MTTINHLRHGDLFIRRVECFPDGEEIPHDDSFVLLHGESGNSHRVHLIAQDKIRKAGNVLFLSVTIPAPLTHEEHGLIEIPAGIWKVEREEEFSYYDLEMRTVLD